MKAKISLNDDKRYLKDISLDIKFEEFMERIECLFRTSLQNSKLIYQENGEKITIYDSNSLHNAISSFQSNTIHFFLHPKTNRQTKQTEDNFFQHQLFFASIKSMHKYPSSKFSEGMSNNLQKILKELNQEDWNESKKFYSTLLQDNEFEEEGDFEMLNSEAQIDHHEKFLLELNNLEVPKTELNLEKIEEQLSPKSRAIKFGSKMKEGAKIFFGNLFNQDKSVVKEIDWQNLSNHLSEMGFNDHQENIKILISVNGDLNKAVTKLINKKK